MRFKNPRGHAVVVAVVTIVVAVVVEVATAGLATGIFLGVDATSCKLNFIWGCDTGSPSSGGSAAGIQTTPTFTTPPPDAPAIGATNFYATPSLVQSGSKTTLNWNVTNATTCSVTGGPLNGSGAGTGTGSVQTGTISSATDYTLTCQNGNSAPASFRIRVNVIPRYQEI